MASRSKTAGKEFNIQYSLRDYVFPKEALIKKVRFDDAYMHVALTDKRIISIPLEWIPTLYNAKPEEREKCQINRTKRMIVWDPSVCQINEEIRIEDYLQTPVFEAEKISQPVREKKAAYKTAKK